jgi:hypothetical protein
MTDTTVTDTTTEDTTTEDKASAVDELIAAAQAPRAKKVIVDPTVLLAGEEIKEAEKLKREAEKASKKAAVVAEKAQKAAAKAAKKAEKAAEKAAAAPSHTSKLAKAAARLPELSEAAREVLDLCSTCGTASLNALSLHIQHLIRVRATEASRTASKPTVGDRVTIVSCSDARYLGKVATVTGVHRIRLHARPDGAKSDVYLFHADVEPVSVPAEVEVEVEDAAAAE